MSDLVVPASLTLKRDEGLTVVWADGQTSHYPLFYLRSLCPCAACKEVRSAPKQAKSSLNILPGNYATPLSVTNVERVGNYALRLEWSDEHASGIYSFQYLRQIMREEQKPAPPQQS